MVNALKSLSVMEMRKRTSQVAAPGRMFRNLADKLSKLAVGTSAVVPSARGRLAPNCQPGWAQQQAQLLGQRALGHRARTWSPLGFISL